VERRILATHPMHLFRIIQDVDAYAQFLPLCTDSKILCVYNGGRTFEATLTVGFLSQRILGGRGFTETYTSRVQVQPENMTIATTSIESRLFDSLKSRWKLGEVWEPPEKVSSIRQDGDQHDDIDDGTSSSNNSCGGDPSRLQLPHCDVEFEVEMTVSDPMIIQVLDAILKSVAEKQVEAFDQRCREISLPEDIQASIQYESEKRQQLHHGNNKKWQ